MPSTETRFEATQDVLARSKRAMDALASVVHLSAQDADGVLINPRMKLAAMKAARDHLDQAIATIERKWPA
jgi:hypothetical protein